MIKKAYYLIKVIPAFFVFALLLSSCSSNDWSQFRGPDFNMVVDGKSLPTQWGNDTNIAWTYDIEGISWSSPIVTGNKVIISTAFAEKKTPRPEQGPPPGGNRPPMPQNRGSGQPNQEPPVGTRQPPVAGQGLAPPAPPQPDASPTTHQTQPHPH